MSGGAAIRWAEAHAVATELVGLLADSCERIEIAGSIRRRKGEVHDLELVVIPRHEQRPVAGLLETTWVPVNLLDEQLGRLRMGHQVRLRPVTVRRAGGAVETQERDGDLYKALEFRGMPVDLFITDAERWGCIFALRTGPGDWNERVVTDCKRWFRTVSGGRVQHLGRPVPTPEEADFFRALGVPWVEPADRSLATLRFDPELLRDGAS